MAFCLVPVGKGRTIVLDKTIILVGRHPDCDVVLSRSRKISRKHCCLALVDDRLVIRDLGSMNGVWVNGERVQRQNDIAIGDQVSIGDCVYKLEQQNIERSKKKKSDKKDADKPAPLDMSQDVPVVVPDEDDDFDDELAGDVVPLDDEDDDDDVVPLDEEPSGDVIPLEPIDDDDSAEFDVIPLEDSDPDNLDMLDDDDDKKPEESDDYIPLVDL